MDIEHLHFNFGTFNSSAHIMRELPAIKEIARDFGGDFFKPLFVCDSNTRHLAVGICGDAPVCILEAGESHKEWQAVETILRCAHDAGLGRDGVFIGVGGGVVGDLCAFAASIYMRGCSLALVPTTLLAMVDAGLGGKTGFDLWGIKNLAGTFFPARHVYISTESLSSLPPLEWKSGMAELIKTAVLDGNNFLEEIAAIADSFPKGSFANGFPSDFASQLLAARPQALTRCISRAIGFKGGIVEQDPQETGNGDSSAAGRVLLNLGHTFGHALESVAGLGTISHGEAVAWGIARSCDLGVELGICPRLRAEQIQTLLTAYGYETAAAHPLMGGREAFIRALGSDKKKRGDKLCFIVPDEKSARPVRLSQSSLIDTIGRIAGMQPA